MLSKTLNDKIIKEKLDYELYKKYIYYRNNYLDFDDKLLTKYLEILKEYALINNLKFYALIFIYLDNHLVYKKESLYTKDNIIKLDESNLLHKEMDISNLEQGELRNVLKTKGFVSIDTNSTPFINDDTLFIPALFKSINNESLDNKAPLIKSIKELNKVLKELYLKFNEKYEYVIPNLDIEQEYNLIKDNEYSNYLDLDSINTDNTYISSFKYLENKLFQETASELENAGLNIEFFYLKNFLNQYGIAKFNDRQNIVIEQTKLFQEILDNIYQKNKYKLLLDNKISLKLNKSIKYNNYSLISNKSNLLSINNKHYLLMISAFVLAIDKYSPLLRLSSSSFANERYLKTKEIPNFIITISLNEEIEKYLNNPKLFHNQNIIYDRNITSSISLLDNKIEFKLLGNYIDSTFFNICLNTILIEAFKEISLRLNKEKEEDIIKDIYLKHKKIIYNDDNYSNNYLKEVNKRKLPKLDDYYKSLDYLIKYRDIFINNKIMNHNEIEVRYEIYKKQYISSFQKEYEVANEIISKEILPYLEKKLIYISNISKEYLSEYFIDKVEVIKQLSDKVFKLKIKIQELLKDLEIKNNLDLKYERLIKEDLITELQECYKRLKEYVE